MPRGHGSSCVCELCTCDLHSCPPKSQPLGQGYEPAVLKTTNQLAYTPKPVSPPKKSVHSSQELTTEEFPFEGESTAKSDYKAHPIEYTPPKRNNSASPPPSTKFTANSTNRIDYPSYDGHYVPPSRATQNEYKPSNLKFDGETTNKSSYKAHNITIEEQRMSTLLKQKEYHNPTGGVTGESTHKLDYSPPPPNAYAKRISLGVHTAPSGNVPFTGTSTTHSDFVYTPPQHKKPCPVLRLPPRAPSEDGHIYYHYDSVPPTPTM